MDRREFLKKVGAAGTVAGLAGSLTPSLSAGIVGGRITKPTDLFHVINSRLLRHTQDKVDCDGTVYNIPGTYFGEKHWIPEKTNDEDRFITKTPKAGYLFVPAYKQTNEFKTNCDCLNTMIAAGTDRNIVIHDQNAKRGHLTDHLLDCMREFQNNNHDHPITDFLIFEYMAVKLSEKDRIHTLPEYAQNVKLILESLHFADNGKNIILGVNRYKHHRYLYRKDDHIGVCMTDNRDVLIGTY